MGSISNFQLPFYLLPPKYNDLQKDLVTQKEYWYASQLKRVSTSDQRSADITLLTDEGDRVTLSASSLLQTFDVSYNSQGLMNGEKTKVQMEASGLFFRDKMAISVEGDLNEQELADIQRIIQELEEVVMDFFSGNFDEIIGKAFQIGDMGSLSGLEARFSHHHSLSVEQQRTVEIANIPFELPESDTTRNKQLMGETIEDLVDKMLEIVDHTKARLDKMAKHMPRLINDLFERIADKNYLDEPQRNLAESIESDFLQRLADKLINDEPRGNAAPLNQFGGKNFDKHPTPRG